MESALTPPDPSASLVPPTAKHAPATQPTPALPAESGLSNLQVNASLLLFLIQLFSQ